MSEAGSQDPLVVLLGFGWVVLYPLAVDGVSTLMGRAGAVSAPEQDAAA